MRFILLLPFCLSLFFTSLSASSTNGGYRIEVEIQHFEGDTLFLGYYFGKAQYLKDTAALVKGNFVFEGDSALAPGVYLLVIPPDNKFIHVIVTENEQRFSMTVDLDKIVPSARFKGSPESDIYYDYLRELDKRRPMADSLRKLIANDSLHRSDHQAKLDKIDNEVTNVQDDIRSKHPSSMTAMLIWANREIVIPEYKEIPEEDRKQKQYEYYRAHYFDHIDFNDPRMMRSAMIHPKVDYFLQKLTYQVPDSQSVAIQYLLDKMINNKEVFQYYLVYFLNEAVKSKKMGMDVIYVDLVDKYYAKGYAKWMEKEQLDKLIAQANVLRPILINKIAPDIKLYKESGEELTLHSIKSDYTILFFWDPECGHCKKSTPAMIDFYNSYKDKGVELVAVCTKTGNDISACWDTIRSRDMDVWVNVSDPMLRSRYKTIYDIKTTPQIFILDRNKKILVKKIAAEDLKAVMDEIIKTDEKKLKE